MCCEHTTLDLTAPTGMIQCCFTDGAAGNHQPMGSSIVESASLVLRIESFSDAVITLTSSSLGMTFLRVNLVLI
jgi:hypothetical protein